MRRRATLVSYCPYSTWRCLRYLLLVVFTMSCAPNLPNLGAALLNHSCAPNCVVIYITGDLLQVRAARDVAIGEELTIAYTDLALPTRIRSAALRGSYGFECDCSRCYV